MGQFVDTSFPTTGWLDEGMTAYIDAPPVSVASTPGGVTEQRIAVSSSGRYTIELASQGRTTTQMQSLWEFYLSVGGWLNSFRFRDPRSYYNSVTKQTLGTGDGSDLTFQCIHSFGSGYDHTVTKLASGTVTVYITDNASPSNDVEQTTRYSVGLTTGIITFSADVTGSVENATSSTTCRVTSTGHGLVTGDTVHWSTFTGDWAALNNHRYAITKINADNFTIPVDTSGFTAYNTSPSNGGVFHTIPQAGELVKATFTHDYQVRFASPMTGPLTANGQAYMMGNVMMVEVSES